jgi:hypothetical protein
MGQENVGMDQENIKKSGSGFNTGVENEKTGGW